MKSVRLFTQSIEGYPTITGMCDAAAAPRISAGCIVGSINKMVAPARRRSPGRDDSSRQLGQGPSSRRLFGAVPQNAAADA